MMPELQDATKSSNQPAPPPRFSVCPSPEKPARFAIWDSHRQRHCGRTFFSTDGSDQDRFYIEEWASELVAQIMAAWYEAEPYWVNYQTVAKK